MEVVSTCPRCDDEGWICEVHPNQPVGHDENCGGPGVPCPECNTTLPEYLRDADRRLLDLVIDDETGRISNTVTETITQNPGCP